MTHPAPAGAAAPATPNLRELLVELIERGGSDLHISAGQQPMMRVHGEMVGSKRSVAPMGAKDTLALVYTVLTEAQKKKFETENDIDFSFGIQGLSRFRGNAFKQRGAVSCVVRQIPFKVKTFDELKLPPIVKTLADKHRGLILVTGPTGSGKSTTLAAIIDHINTTRQGHIITMEDPIEFMHQHKNCVVNQREIGADTKSFAAGLKYALRQDPDVILVGELRDHETIHAALTIAETGHLCLATLHTNTAYEAIDRIIDVFPANQQQQVKTQLAAVLQGVITQILVPVDHGKARAMCMEILVSTPAISALVRDGKTHQLYSSMQTGRSDGMQLMNDSLKELVRQGRLHRDEAFKISPKPGELVEEFSTAKYAAPLPRK